MVLHRPLPFSTSPASRADGTRRRRHRRRSSNVGGDDAAATDGGNDDGAIVRAQPHALQAFRFLSRSGQLFLAEQLAAAGVWDTGSSGNGRGGAASAATAATDNARDENEESGGVRAIGRERAKEGLRTAWMAARLKPAMRKELKEKRERVMRALEDIRRLAGSRGTIFLLPRVGIETGGAAAEGWDLRPVPSQHEVVRGTGSRDRCRGVGVFREFQQSCFLGISGQFPKERIQARI